jgi:hypothetical protein
MEMTEGRCEGRMTCLGVEELVDVDDASLRDENKFPTTTDGEIHSRATIGTVSSAEI